VTERGATSHDGGTLATRAAAAPAWRYVVGGLVASASAAAINLAWRNAYPGLTGYTVPAAIDPPSVAIATVLSIWLAAGVYLLLSRGFVIATPLYVVGCAATAASTCIAPFTPVLPDGMPVPEGFPLLTIPMHLVAGLMAAVVVPIVVVAGVRPRA
jgi:hypothetical protein